MFQKINNYLLQKAPLLWLNQVHLLVIVWITFIFLAAVSYFSFEPTFDDLLTPALSLPFTILAFVIIMATWIVLSNRYNPNTFHDKYTWLDDVKNYLLKLVIVGITYITVIHLIPAGMNVLNSNTITDQEVVDYEVTENIINNNILENLANNYLLSKDWVITPNGIRNEPTHSLEELSSQNKWAEQLYDNKEIKNGDFNVFYNFLKDNSKALGYNFKYETSAEFITALENLKKVQLFNSKSLINKYYKEAVDNNQTVNARYISSNTYKVKKAKVSGWAWFGEFEYSIPVLAALALLGTLPWLYQKIGGKSFVFAALCLVLASPIIGIIVFFIDVILDINIDEIGYISIILLVQLFFTVRAFTYYSKQEKNVASGAYTLTALVGLPMTVFTCGVLIFDELFSGQEENYYICILGVSCILGFILLNILLRNTLTKIYNFPQSK